MGLRYLLLTAKLLWSKFSFPPHRFHLLVVVVQGRLFYLRSFRFLYLFRHLTLMLQILLMPALLDPKGSKLPKLVGCYGALGLVTTPFPFCRLFTIKDKCKKVFYTNTQVCNSCFNSALAWLLWRCSRIFYHLYRTFTLQITPIELFDFFIFSILFHILCCFWVHL